jgi:cytochrome c553
MKYLLILSIFSLTLFSNENSKALYSSCKFCHGLKGEKMYADIVPNINRLDFNILKIKLELYKKGLINEYGFGPIMEQQMKNIPDDRILQLSKYIKQLKEENK